MKASIVILCTTLLCGCVTGTHIITGNARPAIAADGVKIYAVMPEKAQIIGIVNAQSGYGNDQQAVDRMMLELKNQAGKIGANGIIMGAAPSTTSTPVYVYNPYGGMIVNGSSTSLSATAIFVP